jgi:polyhydroxyalkanoate synthesis regulator phasin
MIRNKKIMIPAMALLILLGAGALGINSLYASEDNPRSSLIEKIAQKFNLNKDEVQKVFDEEREERVTAMEERFAKILDEAVAKGELTEAQKSLIIAKRAEMKSDFESKRDENKDLSREEMQTKIKAERESLEKWASDNGINVKYLMGMGGFGRGGHGGPYGPKNEK